MNIKPKKNFFISYSSNDSKWAQWIAYNLERIGCSIILDTRDFEAGSNFITEIDLALENCEQVIALLSQSYLEKDYCTVEWTNAFASDPKKKLVPIRIDNIKPRGVLTATSFIDMYNKPETKCLSLLQNIAENVLVTTNPFPSFPGKIILDTTDKNDIKIHYTQLIDENENSNFIVRKIASNKALNLSKVSNPYLRSSDFLEPRQSTNIESFILLPHIQYITQPSQHLKYSPIVSINNFDMTQLDSKLKTSLDEDIVELLTSKPRTLLATQKLTLYSALGKLLRFNFIVSAVIPSEFLKLGKRMTNSVLKSLCMQYINPLASYHNSLGFNSTKIYLSDIGRIKTSNDCFNSKIIGYSKSVLNVHFKKQKNYQVHGITESLKYVTAATKHIAWAVHTAANNKNLDYLKMLALQKQPIE